MSTSDAAAGATPSAMAAVRPHPAASCARPSSRRLAADRRFRRPGRVGGGLFSFCNRDNDATVRNVVRNISRAREAQGRRFGKYAKSLGKREAQGRRFGKNEEKRHLGPKFASRNQHQKCWFLRSRQYKFCTGWFCNRGHIRFCCNRLYDVCCDPDSVYNEPE